MSVKFQEGTKAVKRISKLISVSLSDIHTESIDCTMRLSIRRTCWLLAASPVLVALTPPSNISSYSFTTPSELKDKSLSLNALTSLTHDDDYKEEQQCHAVHLVPSENLQERCAYVTQYCTDYKIGFINYVTFYYCHGAKLLKLMLYSLILVILFTTLGITASEFLCPNLNTISKFFKMSESLAGVTLLALGNGSPDVFSTLESLKIGSGSLAIAELIGAALFITCVVVGAMSIIHPFTVVKKPFFRDVIFLLISLSVTIIALSDGKITMLESLVMILMYSIYVVFVVCWDWVVKKNRRLQFIEQKIRNYYYDESNRHSMTKYQVEQNTEGTNDEDILNSFENNVGIEALDSSTAQDTNMLDEWTENSLNKIMYRPSILGALELNTKMANFEQSPGSKDAISLHTIPSRAHSEPNPLIKLSSKPTFRDDGYNTDEESSRPLTSPAGFEPYFDDPLDTATLDPVIARPDFIDAQIAVKDRLSYFLKNRKLFDKNSSLLFIILPTLENFQEKSIFDKTFSILCIPLLTLLRLTIPVVHSHGDDEQDSYELLDKASFLLLAQSVLSPFAIFILFVYDGEGISITQVVTSLMFALCLLAITIQGKKSYKEGSTRVLYVLKIFFALFGFIVSIIWISAIATELISIIKFFAVLFNLSDAILGVTVFALGNSLGDFISNFTIAKMGFPMMALSACFGGPLLNILLGIGGSGVFILSNMDQELDIEISNTLIVSISALFINLLFLLIFVPLNNWQMNALTGWFMVGLWIIATTICVVLEVTTQ